MDEKSSMGLLTLTLTLVVIVFVLSGQDNYLVWMPNVLTAN